MNRTTRTTTIVAVGVATALGCLTLQANAKVMAAKPKPAKMQPATPEGARKAIAQDATKLLEPAFLV